MKYRLVEEDGMFFIIDSESYKVVFFVDTNEKIGLDYTDDKPIKFEYENR